MDCWFATMPLLSPMMGHQNNSCYNKFTEYDVECHKRFNLSLTLIGFQMKWLKFDLINSIIIKSLRFESRKCYVDPRIL